MKRVNAEAIIGFSLSESITGIIVAVNGILSTNALDNADRRYDYQKSKPGIPICYINREI